SDGVISGTPSATGSFNFEITARDANNCPGSRSYSIDIECGNVTLSPSVLVGGTVNVPYNAILSAYGGTPPFSYSLIAGTLPNGINLMPQGTLSGTPTVSGLFNFTIKASDANGCGGTRKYSINTQALLFDDFNGSSGIDVVKGSWNEAN